LIFIVAGPGGVGKGTLVAELLGRLEGLHLSRSWTTRPRRPGEAEDSYVFTDRPSFEAHAASGGFLEWTEFPGNGHLYGTPLPDPAAPGDLLLEIDVEGARQVKERFPDAVVLAVTPPSLDALRERLRGRGDDEESVRRRLELGRLEVEVARAMADHEIVNDDLYRAAGELADIIKSRRSALPG
jgi:guanylate kinase